MWGFVMRKDDIKFLAEHTHKLESQLTAAQAEIAELKEMIKREVVPDVKDAEIARLQYAEAEFKQWRQEDQSEIAKLKEQLKDELKYRQECLRSANIEVNKLKSELESFKTGYKESDNQLNVLMPKLLTTKDELKKSNQFNKQLQSALDVAVEALGATWPNVFQEIYEHHQAALEKIKQIRGEK